MTTRVIVDEPTTPGLAPERDAFIGARLELATAGVVAFALLATAEGEACTADLATDEADDGTELAGTPVNLLLDARPG
tara:strand:+ start:735 stop:968 length:234 start_codon:yes stop_codon:yes gene_type:complete